MFDAIILAGGSARRLGGVDKPALQVGSRSLLEHAVAAVELANRVVVVGPQRDLVADVYWCREEPPGGGPVAAIGAGVAEVQASVVVVLAADLPMVGPAVPQLLAGLHGGDDCAVLIDSGGRRNYLAAAWHVAALRHALACLPELSGVAARTLYESARVTRVLDHGGWSQDCDTWADLAAARGPDEETHE